jgi:hypothetical protein
MKMKKMAVLSAATVGLLWGAGADAQVFNYNQGDLVLGFRSAGPSDLVVDIGSASLYSGATGPITISGVKYTSTQFTDANLDMNNLFFSVFGDTASKDLWMTRARSSNSTQTTPWTAGNLFAQGPTAGRIEAIAAGAGDISLGESAGADNTATAVVMPSSYNSGGDASYTVGVGANGNFGNTFPGIVEGNTTAGFSTGSTPLLLDLYQLNTANAGNPGQFLGDFELDPNGTLTFNPVPEPTTWATFGVGIMLLAAVQKFRRTA